MGNCLRNGSPAASNNHHRRFAANKEADDPGSPTLTYASSTVYHAAKSHFSETASEGNWDANTVYSAAKSHFSDTVAEGNEGPNLSIRKAGAKDCLKGALSNLKAFTRSVLLLGRNEGPNPSVRRVWVEDFLKGALTSNLKAFTFAELKTATGNFKKRNLIGEGGFGRVYKGWIDERTFAPSKPGSGMVVSVKKWSRHSQQGLGEWESEVSILGKLSHPNLIKLLGFCFETVKNTDELLFVYEFMPNGSLADHLFKKNPTIEPLSWNLRLKIAIGAARGIAFLHRSQIIFRNFTPSNILLDENYNAKLSDFGLARVGPAEGHSHVSTVLMGTYGYAAPEYIATGHLYVKSDVYGFGVVLLEMMTGLRAIDVDRPGRRKYLVDWLKPFLTNRERLKDIMDASIQGQYSFKAMLRAAQITSRCLEQDPSSRPSMVEVVQALMRIELIEERPQ